MFPEPPVLKTANASPNGCPTLPATMFVMQRRLLNFFYATRAQSQRIEWVFFLRTVDNTLWTERMLAEKGLPPTWVLFVEADANFPYQGRFTSGCFSTQRIIRPRKAAWNILSESQSLVADVLAEFSKRLPEVT
jgi:hypothetical protein